VNTGNTEPFKGFGHVAISVDNIQAACKRLEDMACQFQKKLSDGRMRASLNYPQIANMLG
jgi:lactoylglutathione lyase